MTRTLRSITAGVVAVLFMPPGASAQAAAPFTRITTGDFVTTPASYWVGSWGDYDDDGWVDLFVGTLFASKRNFLYRNNRDGSFTLVDEAKRTCRLHCCGRGSRGQGSIDELLTLVNIGLGNALNGCGG